MNCATVGTPARPMSQYLSPTICMTLHLFSRSEIIKIFDKIPCAICDGGSWAITGWETIDESAIPTSLLPLLYHRSQGSSSGCASPSYLSSTKDNVKTTAENHRNRVETIRKRVGSRDIVVKNILMGQHCAPVLD